MKLRRRLGLEWAGVAIIASLIVALLSHWNSLSSFDNLLYDQLSEWSRPEASEDVLIIAIDEDSLAELGKWPWDRNRHAELFDVISKANAKAVAFDILLSENGDEEGDQVLAESMAGVENLILPVHFVVPGQNGAPFDVKQPIPVFVDSATGLGHVALTFDSDGAVRRTNLCFGGQGDGEPWPHLMDQVYRTVHGQQSAEHSRNAACERPLLFRYAQRGSHSTISYLSVINGEVPPAFFQDRIILVGATAQGLGDQHPVPLGDGGTMAGVEIMANMYGTMERDDFITPLPFWQQIILSLVPLWILLMGFWRWRPRTILLVSIGLIATVLITSLGLLAIEFWFAPGAALVGLALVYPVWGWRRLQATSDFMDEELENFRASKAEIPVMAEPLGPVDVVTGQAEQLTHAIGHMRDLRRFINDALTNLPDPMFITDLSGQVKFVNRLAETGLEGNVEGLALDEMLDRIVSPDDLDDVKEYLSLEIPPEQHDYVDFTSLDGQVFAMRRAKVVSDEGELRGHIQYLADITALANAAQEREEVLQLLSHDMRAPQAAILALLEGQDSDDSKTRIAKHARRTLALADNFVGLARIKSSEFDGEDVLLSELVAEASDSLWPLANARGISCKVDDQSEGAFVLGEPSSLHRSFVNLIDNAIKYSPDGSTVDVTLRNIEIDKLPHVSVTIADQGEGISDEMLGQLFERFASDDSGSKGSVKGSGLGLNFVAAVIERHGGSITAQNRKGNSGAEFSVLLPLAPEPQEFE